MSSLRQQCDFMSNVVQHALLLGMSREQFDKLADTAWLVHTAEREEPAPETLQVLSEKGGQAEADALKPSPTAGEAVHGSPAGPRAAATWRCTICNNVNPDDATHCRQCEYSRMVTRDGVLVPRHGRL